MEQNNSQHINVTSAVQRIIMENPAYCSVNNLHMVSGHRINTLMFLSFVWTYLCAICRIIADILV